MQAGNRLKPTYVIRSVVVPQALAPARKDGPLNNLRNLALWIVVALLLVFLFNLFQGTAKQANSAAINYTKFRQ